MYPATQDASKPEFFLAAYTNYGEGDQTDGSLKLTYDHQPVWVIRFTDVPDSASGAGGAPGDTSPETTGNEIVLHDIVVVADADTGRPLEVLSAYPTRRLSRRQLHPAATAQGSSSRQQHRRKSVGDRLRVGAGRAAAGCGLVRASDDERQDEAWAFG